MLPLEEGYFTVPEKDGERPRLLGSYSKAADTYFFPRRKRCPITEQPVTDVELSSEGTLYSWTFVVSPWMGKGKFADGIGGHGVGQIDLPEGVRVQGVIEGDMGDWSCGMAMGLDLMPIMKDSDGNDLCTFRFVPLEGPEANKAKEASQ